MFPVGLEDIGEASLFAEMKAITRMRYIRTALEDKTFVKAGSLGEIEIFQQSFRITNHDVLDYSR